MSCLDYWNGILAGLPASTLAPLQSMHAECRGPSHGRYHLRKTASATLCGHCTGCRLSIEVTSWNCVSWWTPSTIVPVRLTLRTQYPYRRFLVTTGSISPPHTSTMYLLLSPELVIGLSLFNAGSWEWDNLPSDIRYISDVSLFKSTIKTLL